MAAAEMQGQRVAVIGGGLAGVAAAEALSRFPFKVHIFEARRSLGGRAGAYRDPDQPSLIDRCQHVAMGCCTNFLDLCRRLDLNDCFRRDTRLYFVDTSGTVHPFSASTWLPAPLHLAAAFLRQKYLSRTDRRGIARALWAMAPPQTATKFASERMLPWLEKQGQSEEAIHRFWEVVLVSALGAPLADVSFVAARKVFVDGFLRHRQAYNLHVPTIPLQDVLDVRAAQHLGERGVDISRQLPVKSITYSHAQFHVQVGTGHVETYDNVVCAVPWHQVSRLFSDTLLSLLPQLEHVGEIESSPISSVHLWLDRPLTHLPHVVLLDRLSQWVFQHGERQLGDTPAHYYQVVISASKSLVGSNAQKLAHQVLGELSEAFHATSPPRLLDFQVVTEKQAVFSATPQLEPLRPAQGTMLAGLALAGDWTQTTWPSTMEGAVRSGYLAAEAILRRYGHYQPVRQPELPPALLPRLLWGLAADELSPLPSGG